MGTVEHASVVRPCRGERVSGDAAFVAERDGSIFFAIIDALGHGPRAHETATRMVAYLRDAASQEVVELLLKLDAHVRGSVGAGAGLCHVDLETGSLRYAGIGNTVIRRFGSNDTKLVSQGGIIGGHMRTPQEQTLTLQNGDLLLFHTDGVSERFGTSDYPEILGHDVRVVAGRIVKNFGKDHDDAGCIVAKYRA